MKKAQGVTQSELDVMCSPNPGRTLAALILWLGPREAAYRLRLGTSELSRLASRLGAGGAVAIYTARRELTKLRAELRELEQWQRGATNLSSYAAMDATQVREMLARLDSSSGRSATRRLTFLKGKIRQLKTTVRTYRRELPKREKQGCKG